MVFRRGAPSGFFRWAEKVADSPTVHMSSFEEGLGRIMFVASALEHERPFPAPSLQVSYHASEERGETCPSVCIFYFEVPRPVKSRKRDITSAEQRLPLPRVDAQASDTRTGIGGWFPARDQECRLSPWLSSWFSLEITRKDFPWIFEKGNRPSLVMSTLEAFAMLVALKLNFGQEPEADDTRVSIISFHN